MNATTLGSALIVILLIASEGCAHKEPVYGEESVRFLATARRQVWAIAPVVNLSGERGVDPFLQADLVFQQMQQIRGVTVIPVNRVAEVYATLHLDGVSTPEQAALVCDLLHCDGLIVPTVTIFDPYNPPKLGAALQLFIKPGSYARPSNLDPRELVRLTKPAEGQSTPVSSDAVQTVGMFDAANGSVRDRLHLYATGRHDPMGPLGEKEYLVSMDRYCGFVYSELIDQLIISPRLKGL